MGPLNSYLTSFTSPNRYFRAHIFNEMLKAVAKKNFFTWNPLNKFPHCVYVHEFISKNSLTLENVLSVRNSQNEIENYKLSQTPVRFQKNPTHFLLAKWVIKSFSFCSPQIKLVGEWLFATLLVHVHVPGYMENF